MQILPKLQNGSNSRQYTNVALYNFENIPEYSGEPYVILNNNIPDFDESDYTAESFEIYAELDSLGRCGVAYANICKEIMPQDGETRGEIGSIKPSGWQTQRYNGVVDGNYLYNPPQKNLEYYC